MTYPKEVLEALERDHGITIVKGKGGESGDTRLAYGATCTWFGPIQEVGGGRVCRDNTRCRAVRTVAACCSSCLPKRSGGTASISTSAKDIRATAQCGNGSERRRFASRFATEFMRSKRPTPLPNNPE